MTTQQVVFFGKGSKIVYFRQTPECCHALGVNHGTIITFDQEESVKMNEGQVEVVADWRWLL
ncbi:MAG: hypothetical protein KKA07_07890 [Bacteroidetes bacterium]|nr:hypothetical protein [Bacteroidota bacterium]MBU1718984.1 hypothetical protein [Bacteroidota bacterium]